MYQVYTDWDMSSICLVYVWYYFGMFQPGLDKPGPGLDTRYIYLVEIYQVYMPGWNIPGIYTWYTLSRTIIYSNLLGIPGIS
jgi:hypothetical protein